MSRFTKVKDASGVNALADLLNGNTRRLPVAVISIPAGRQSPWIDADEVAREVGNLADVYVIQTGKLTWELAARLPEGTQVFGGAGRVYPTGHQWSANLSSSPLRFAFNKSDGQTATKDLISDCLRMAAAAGLLQTQSTSNLTEVTAIVRNTIAGRGVVELPKRVLGSVAEELTVPDVRIERILQPGQQISGRYDARTGRVDITASLRSSSTALADYVVGDVVLTRVAMVRKRKAELVLYPKTDAEPVTVAVLQEEVTLNPFDDLRDLMTVGEVIPARVVATGPDWKLVLNDVDDEEEIVPAPSLLLGGPPWLVEEPIQPEAEEPEPLAPPLLQQQAPESPAPPEPTPTDSAEEQAPKPRPTPMVLDRNRPRATPPPTVAKEVDSAAKVPPNTRKLLLTIDGLKAEIVQLKRGQDSIQEQLTAAEHNAEQLRYLLDQAERRANRAEHDLKASRSRLRRAGSAKSNPGEARVPVFADPERQFRYLVETQWAIRTLPSEQTSRPLPDYQLGPNFLASLSILEGIKTEKVADVAFEILTGVAHDQAGREVHRLRSGPGGDDPIRVRDDGAVAWRASLQVKTPSARRIHYWVLPNGQIELARVTTHDDFAA